MKPFITICSLLLLMTSCHSSTEDPLPPKSPIEPPVEEGTPLLFEPEDMVSITVGDEAFMVDFSRSDDIQYFYEQQYWELKEGEYVPWVFFPKTTREGYINFYKQMNGFFSATLETAKYSEIDFVKAEYTLAQECFSDRCNTETRKEVLQLVIDKQRRKYENNVYYSYAIHSGVFLMAVILVKEYVLSAKYIDHETLQKALLFLNDFDYFTEGPVNYGKDFSELIVECARNFLADNN